MSEDGARSSSYETGPGPGHNESPATDYRTELNPVSNIPGGKLDALYRAYAPVLAAKLRQTFGNGPPDPDDLTQLAFQKLIERGDISDISNLKGFLWNTARNLLFNDRRNRITRSKYDFEIEHLFFPNRGADSTPESVIGAREELRAINKAFDQMPNKRRLAFIMHRIDGLSVAEVARRLGIARSPARRHILRAMEDIQVALAALKSGETR